MLKIEIGEPYPWKSAKVLTEGAEFNFTSHVNLLRLYLHSPTEEEIRAVRLEEVAFALAVEEGIIFLLSRFGDTIPWFDAPYSLHLLGMEEQPRHASPKATRPPVVINVVLIDIATNIVRALRECTLSPASTKALFRAAEEQALNPTTRAQHDVALARAYSRYPTSESLLGRAIPLA